MIGFLLPLALWTGSAAADEASCRACCEASGLGDCQPSLRVVGEDSMVVARGTSFEVIGLWVTGCTAPAFFEVGESATFDHQPVVGEVATGLASPKLLRCYIEACALPEGTCPEASAGHPVLRRCADGGAVTDQDLSRAGGPAPTGTVTVMVKGRPLLVTETASTAPAPGRPGGVSAPATTRALATGMQATPPQDPGPAPDVTVPAWSERCNAPEALAKESRRHLEIGNDAEIAGQLARAADEYRAALTMDSCNQFAWAALGRLALRLDQPAQAVEALKVVLELQPTHYGAATDLGKAYEALGQRARAIEAYRAAVEVRPDHTPATTALDRLGEPAR